MKPRTKEHNKKIQEALLSKWIIESITKICPICKIEKPRTDYRYRYNCNSQWIRYRHAYCVVCEKKYNVEKQKRNMERHPELKEKRDYYNRKCIFKKKYWITIWDYDLMYKEQEWKCKICWTDKLSPGRKHLFVDHCHTTGKIRWLLCQQCNSLLWYSNDNTEILKSAIKYLTHQDVPWRK
jgi:hypothetical protein